MIFIKVITDFKYFLFFSQERNIAEKFSLNAKINNLTNNYLIL